MVVRWVVEYLPRDSAVQPADAFIGDDDGACAVPSDGDVVLDEGVRYDRVLAEEDPPWGNNRGTTWHHDGILG